MRRRLLFLFSLMLSVPALLAQETAALQLGSVFVRHDGTPQGAVEARSIKDTLYSKERKVWVYTPAGYSKNHAPYRLLICFDGDSFLEGGLGLPIILDNLIAAAKIPPTLALMIDNGSGRERQEDLANHRRFADFMVKDLMPWAHENWNVSASATDVTLEGYSAGGLAAAFVALEYPTIFGNVISQSGAFWRGAEGSNDAPYEWLTMEVKRRPAAQVRFYLEVGGNENRHVAGRGPIFIEANRRFRDALKAKGYPVYYKEIPGADHEEGHWRSQLPEAVVAISSPTSVLSKVLPN